MMGTNKEWAVVVAQSVEKSLLTTEVRGSNPVIIKIHNEQLISVNFFEKIIQKKIPGMAN